MAVNSMLFSPFHFFLNILTHGVAFLYCRFHKALNTWSVTQVLWSFYYSTLSLITGDYQTLEWKTHWQSPVCRKILRRKYFVSQSEHSLNSAAVCLTLSGTLMFEMKNSFLHNAFGNYANLFWFIELFVLVILCMNAVLAIIWYIWSKFTKPMSISPTEQKLFCISENNAGFEIRKTLDTLPKAAEPERLDLSTWRNSSDSCTSPLILSTTPINTSYNSWLSSSGGFDTTSSSWNFYQSSPNYSSTPKSPRGERSMLRKLNYSDNIESPYERPIRNMKHLEEYLKVQEERKRKSLSFEESKPFAAKMTSMDSSPMSVLSKCRYQRAYRLANLETTEEDSTEILAGDNVLNKLKITDKTLTIWCERVRKWVCQTILVKLVREIDEINATLTEIGLPEFQIGSVSLFALHQISATKSQHVPTLAAILPYINMHSNQEYLVKRLKDLAHGGCMGEYKWNSGGAYDDKPWCDDLPTDSSLVMYILCCYMDAHLPPDPHFPEGKPFTSKYFKKAPEKLVLSKDLAYIYQSSLNPPHFKVVLGEDLCALAKGRNNMFCALAVFLHYFKIKESGMLGRVNLGQSGLNMLWIID